MKKVHLIKAAVTAIFLTVIFSPGPAAAQGLRDYVTVSGIVRDKETRKPMDNVTVAVPDTGIGTVTNADGRFTIKIKRSIGAAELEFSHLGYANLRYPVGDGDVSGIAVLMSPANIRVDDIVVVYEDPVQLVREAIKRIGDNYSPVPAMLTGFYRETVRKRNKYINVSEAVLYIYKSSYSNPRGTDRTRVYKGRQLVSTRAQDTLQVKLLGGPNTSVNLDIIKDRGMLLNEAELPLYRFGMEPPVTIDGKNHYAVSFRPAVIAGEPLFHGIMYIESGSLTFSRIEFNLDMSDPEKVTRNILRQKPPGLRFKPHEVSYLVTYKEFEGRSYLHYVRSDIGFRCDWKRRLFSTNYMVTAETVITDIATTGITPITYRESFNENHSLSDKVKSFYDENFWEDYNIIEPTESLDAAVNRLKKQKRPDAADTADGDME